MSSSLGRLIVICGLPGSGKTTLAKRLEVERSALRFSADEWMHALSINLHDEAVRDGIEPLQWKLCQQLLAKGLTVIIEWGSWGRWERDILRKRAREIGAAVELHYLSAPVDVLFERIKQRGMENPPITREMVTKWNNIIEVPTPDEVQLFDAVELPGERATRNVVGNAELIALASSVLKPAMVKDRLFGAKPATCSQVLQSIPPAGASAPSVVP